MHLTTGLECATFRTEEHILEVQLDVILNARHFYFWLLVVGTRYIFF